jgi:hypothetical protein
MKTNNDRHNTIRRTGQQSIDDVKKLLLSTSTLEKHHIQVHYNTEHDTNNINNVVEKTTATNNKTNMSSMQKKIRKLSQFAFSLTNLNYTAYAASALEC